MKKKELTQLAIECVDFHAQINEMANFSWANRSPSVCIHQSLNELPSRSTWNEFQFRTKNKTGKKKERKKRCGRSDSPFDAEWCLKQIRIYSRRKFVLTGNLFAMPCFSCCMSRMASASASEVLLSSFFFFKYLSRYLFSVSMFVESMRFLLLLLSPPPPLCCARLLYLYNLIDWMGKKKSWKWNKGWDGA